MRLRLEFGLLLAFALWGLWLSVLGLLRFFSM